MTEPQLPPPSPYGPPVPAQQGPAAPQSPAYQTPPGAYGAPVGGYSIPSGAYQAPQAAEQRPSTLGVISFALSIVAAVVASIIVGIAGYQIGFGLPTIMNDVDSATSDLSFLSPVRDQVLMCEIAFWVGTLAGIAAIVLGIMAIAKRQGRAWGIVALILAGIGPVIFFVVLTITLTAGTGAGAVTYYGGA